MRKRKTATEIAKEVYQQMPHKFLLKHLDKLDELNRDKLDYVVACAYTLGVADAWEEFVSLLDRVEKGGKEFLEEELTKITKEMMFQRAEQDLKKVKGMN